ncbi:hypothetical protein [uncultured Duncaniella sp.]|jgi:hypothetical protein|uniref:hypothetical protein n=1 Tax=uncultured Duncaniella sp. TaxID=2768039 RepID=UPI000F4A3C37|nr:hypothetical protein [uncultured Duncaniella sp.]ROS87281.1 hypothetical protein EEL39_11055 [Muribaculaceae bacterium Isolate-080 (Janvier)]
MITEDLTAHLLHIIAWHRTWLAAKDFGLYGMASRLSSDGNIILFKCRVLRFEVRVPRSGFRKLQIVSVPEFAIENATTRLSSNAGFKRRLEKRILTFEDVNEIIRIASDDIIELNLEI